MSSWPLQLVVAHVVLLSARRDVPARPRARPSAFLCYISGSILRFHASTFQLLRFSYGPHNRQKAACSYLRIGLRLSLPVGYSSPFPLWPGPAPGCGYLIMWLVMLIVIFPHWRCFFCGFGHLAALICISSFESAAFALKCSAVSLYQLQPDIQFIPVPC